MMENIRVSVPANLSGSSFPRGGSVGSSERHRAAASRSNITHVYLCSNVPELALVSVDHVRPMWSLPPSNGRYPPFPAVPGCVNLFRVRILIGVARFAHSRALLQPCFPLPRKFNSRCRLKSLPLVPPLHPPIWRYFSAKVGSSDTKTVVPLFWGKKP